MKTMVFYAAFFFFLVISSKSQMYATGSGGGHMQSCIVWGEPVTLASGILSFNVTCADNKAMVTWSCAANTSDQYLVLEKSTDGIHFTTITSVQLKNNTSQPQQFYFTDEKSGLQKNYYRVKKNAQNNTPEYTRVVITDCGKNTAVPIKIFPNPTTAGIVNIDTKGVNATISVRNIWGQTVITQKATPGISVINLGGLPQGAYQLVMYSDKNITQQIIIYKR